MPAHAGIFGRIQRFQIINAAISLAIVSIVGVIVVQALGGSAPLPRAIGVPRSTSATPAGIAPSASGALPISAPQVSTAPAGSVAGGSSTESSPSNSAAPSSTGLVVAPATNSAPKASAGTPTLGASTARANAHTGKVVGYVPSASGSVGSGLVPVHGLVARSPGVAASTPAPSNVSTTPSASASSSSRQTAVTASAVTNAPPAGPDGTWIVPPVAGLQGVATGPAPAGDVLALGNPGDEYAFDVTTRTWILAPSSGYSYKLGVGYVSGTSSSGASTANLPPTLTSIPPGPDGPWIVAPTASVLDAHGTSLPALPGVAAGPAPAGDVIALGPVGSEYAFDVTTRTWIPQASTSYGYKPGVGYVAAG